MSFGPLGWPVSLFWWFLFSLLACGGFLWYTYTYEFPVFKFFCTVFGVFVLATAVLAILVGDSRQQEQKQQLRKRAK